MTKGGFVGFEKGLGLDKERFVWKTEYTFLIIKDDLLWNHNAFDFGCYEYDRFLYSMKIVRGGWIFFEFGSLRVLIFFHDFPYNAPLVCKRKYAILIIEDFFI